MCRPRCQLVSLEDTPYYHVVSRCVRRSFLCGVDPHTGKSYEHRRSWIETLIHFLSSIFAIDIAAYAVMSNHYHIVLKIDPDQLSSLTDEDILRRWCALYHGPLIVQRMLIGDCLSDTERNQVSEFASVYRKRFGDLGWFMKCLNEPIAREANAEDDCTGHFWESRYKSQALKDERALLSCMAYVDLNPIRAQMSETPETSDYTSIKERAEPSLDLAASIASSFEASSSPKDLTRKPLLQFKTPKKPTSAVELPFEWHDYLNLVDLTGRAVDPRKRGSISNRLPPILSRLEISEAEWVIESCNFEENFRRRQHSSRRTA